MDESDMEEIPTPIGPVKLPPMDAFTPIYCKECGEVVGGHCEEIGGPMPLEDLEYVACPCCGARKCGTMTKPERGE